MEFFQKLSEKGRAVAGNPFGIPEEGWHHYSADGTVTFHSRMNGQDEDSEMKWVVNNEAGEVKKDKQKEVFIDLGGANGVYKGLQFDVFHVKTIAGKKAHTMIGRLKIEEVQGDEISLCKVTKALTR